MTGGATYVISLVEFLIGTLITVINAVACLISMPKSAQTSNLWNKPDIGRRYLTINIWVSNMFLGLIVAVGHVIASDALYRVSKIENTDGIASVVDCFSVNASLLVIASNFLVGLHRPQRCLGRTKSIHVVAAIWTMTAALNFIKAIVSSLYNYNGSACFPCLSNFEVVTLSLLTLCTVVIFLIGAHKVYIKKKRSTEG
uniref:Uncharacterized protein n=1 Tax=Romanomermis culicivorax TaxID=13658 RepID=A0A915KRW8_ROMCU